VLNGSQEYLSPHSTTAESDTEPVYIDVASYYELRQAMLSLVAGHETEGIIRFTSYNGNIEEDLNNAAYSSPTTPPSDHTACPMWAALSTA
jgi:hypothetical protein